VVCVAGPPGAPVGQYLLSYDPEAYQGRGWAEWTSDRAKALVFTDYSTAWEFWRQVPRCRPKRPDGHPNRPLTAFTVSLEPG
jgi:hypothetical protein